MVHNNRISKKGNKLLILRMTVGHNMEILLYFEIVHIRKARFVIKHRTAVDMDNTNPHIQSSKQAGTFDNVWSTNSLKVLFSNYFVGFFQSLINSYVRIIINYTLTNYHFVLL